MICHLRPWMAVRNALGCVGVGLCAACVQGPNYERPTIEVPSSYRFDEAAPVGTRVDDSAWWNAFGDEILNGLVREGVANNRDLHIARRGLMNSTPSSGNAITGFPPSRLWHRCHPPARQRTRRHPVPARRQSDQFDLHVGPLSQLGNRPLGPHPARNRSGARQFAGHDGSTARRRPDVGRLGHQRLRHLARSRQPVAGCGRDARRPKRIRSLVPQAA